ncbi:Basal-body rod modification protein FlgD [Burkholderiaceae bacterium]|nr:Basal-body rod modification protein FlgD [Burkholderiaceae bacterium]
MAVGNIDTNALATPAASPVTAANDTASADRFLKLLVAQMQNQDPLNPLDNAQVTSQMAQINTVTGIEKLNRTVQDLSGQFVQMQALQGAALVGRNVIVPGNQMDIHDGAGRAAFSLTSPADAVKVEMLNAAGHVIDTVQLGAQSAGLHRFDWDASKANGDPDVTFRVTATLGAATLSSTPLMIDKVVAVSANGGVMTLDLERSGGTPYSSLSAFF